MVGISVKPVLKLVVIAAAGALLARKGIYPTKTDLRCRSFE
jgi:predicted permease